MTEKVLLADFLDTAVMVSPDVQLHVFRYTGQGWKYWKTLHPTLKEAHLVKVVEESGEEWGYFKVEVRHSSTNRPIFPNTLYVLLNREGVQRWDTKPLEAETEKDEDPEPAEEIVQVPQVVPNPAVDVAGVVKATLEPITQILTAQMQMTNQLLALLVQGQNQKKEEDPFRELVRLKVEKEKIRLIRELSEESRHGYDDDEAMGIWENATPEDRALARQVIAAYQSGNLGTATTLWMQLQEKNEALANLLLSIAVDEFMKGNIPLPWDASKNKGNANVQEAEQTETESPSVDHARGA